MSIDFTVLKPGFTLNVGDIIRMDGPATHWERAEGKRHVTIRGYANPRRGELILVTEKFLGECCSYE